MWSPDSRKICYTDNGRNIYILDLELNTIRKIDSDEIYFPGPFRDIYGDWSSDSKWILYTKLLKTNLGNISYSLISNNRFSY
jgi:tricorn protease